MNSFLDFFLCVRVCPCMPAFVPQIHLVDEKFIGIYLFSLFYLGLAFYLSKYEDEKSFVCSRKGQVQLNSETEEKISECVCACRRCRRRCSLSCSQLYQLTFFILARAWNECNSLPTSGTSIAYKNVSNFETFIHV